MPLSYFFRFCRNRALSSSFKEEEEEEKEEEEEEKKEEEEKEEEEKEVEASDKNFIRKNNDAKLTSRKQKLA